MLALQCVEPGTFPLPVWVLRLPPTAKKHACEVNWQLSLQQTTVILCWVLKMGGCVDESALIQENSFSHRASRPASVRDAS